MKYNQPYRNDYYSLIGEMCSAINIGSDTHARTDVHVRVSTCPRPAVVRYGIDVLVMRLYGRTESSFHRHKSSGDLLRVAARHKHMTYRSKTKTNSAPKTMGPIIQGHISRRPSERPQCPRFMRNISTRIVCFC